MTKTEISCYTCGEPCYNQGAGYVSICRRCAIEAYKLVRNKDTSLTYFIDTDPKAGDGISVGTWTTALDILRTKYGHDDDAADFYVPTSSAAILSSSAPATNDMPCGYCGNSRYSYQEMVNKIACWKCGQLTEDRP